MILVPFLATIVFVVGFVVAYYFIRGYLPGSRMMVETPISPSETNSATFTLFSVKWCPYSQAAVEAWKSLQSSAPTTYGGYTITFKNVDCESSTSVCKQYGVDAYPTYKLETPTQMYTYEGPANVAVYQEFLKDSLGTPAPSA